MKYNELTTPQKKSSRRVGRGIAAGRGKTAGRGTKGQNARKSGGVRPGFEGGQNPLSQRLPKLRGFKSHRVAVDNVYTGELDALGNEVNNAKLAEAGIVETPYTKVKLITKGEITKKMNVRLQSASKSAIMAIEKAGGTFTVVPQIGREAKKTEKK